MHNTQVNNNSESQKVQGDSRTNAAPWGGFYGFVGMYAIVLALQDAIPAIQRYASHGLFGLSAAVEGLNEQATAAWLNIIAGPGPDSDQSQIQAAINSSLDPTVKAQTVNALNIVFQEHNNEYNESASFFESLNNAINQVSSQTADTEKQLLASYHAGPGPQSQTVTQILTA